MNQKMVTRTSLLLAFILSLTLIGCATREPIGIPNREAVVGAYIAALENGDADAVLALHDPNHPPAADTLTLKLAQFGVNRLKLPK
jgi:hypothetical protein